MFKNYSNACCVGLNLISNQSIIRMEPNTQALIKAAVDPLLAKIEQLEADNREFKARLDNIEALTQQLKKSNTKPPTGKQPAPPKTGPIKDAKKPPEPATNGRPSNPNDKKPKQQDPTKKVLERPATGTTKTIPGAKSTGKKDETKKEEGKKDQHKDDAHKSDQKSQDTKKDDGKHDPVKKDPKALTSPKGPSKDAPKKDTKTPTHEPKTTQPGKNTKSPGTHDKKAGPAVGQKTVPKGEKKTPDAEVAKKQEGKQEHKLQQAHQQQLLGEADKAVQQKPAEPQAEVHHQAPAEVPPPAAGHQVEKPAEPPVEAPAVNLVAEPVADAPAEEVVDQVPEAAGPDGEVVPGKEGQEADVI